MAILSKGTTYADGDQITSTNLNALVDSATFAAGAVESGGGLQLNGSSPAQLKVAGNVDIGTSNLTATGAISLGATTFNDNNITHVGSIALDTIIADNTDVTIDAAGDIILDAGGADILLKDDGTQFGSITNLSGDLIIQSSVQDKDIFIKGDDNGSVITALKLDMSSAGDATFNNKVIATELDIGGDIDVAGTANLDIVDIDGAVDMATTLQVDGVATFTGRDIHSGGITIANAGQIGSVGDTDAIAIASDGVVTLTQKLIGTELDISGNIDVDGTTNLDVVDIDGAVDMATTLALAGNADFNGNLDVAGLTLLTNALTVTGNVDFNGSLDVLGITNLDVVDIDGAVDMATTALVTGVLTTTATQVATGGITSGSSILSDTDSTDSLGSTAVRWLKGWFDTLTAGTLTIGAGSVTDSSGAISFGNENLTTTGTVTAAGTSVFTNLDISGDVDVDGTLNVDAIDIDGNVQVDGTVTVGVNDTGHDVKFYGATSGAYMHWDESTDDLILGGASKLGIGTTSPSYKLDVNGTGRFTSHVQFDGQVTVGANADSDDVKFFGSTSGAYLHWDVSGDHLNLGGGSSLAVTGDAAFDTDTLFVDASTDCVGIGTASAINTQIGGNAKLGAYDSSGARVAIWGNGGRWWYLHGEDSNKFTIGYRASGNTSDGDAIIIDTNGNVGIGTAAPGVPLHIARSGESKLDLEDTGGQRYRLFARNSDDVFGIYDVTNSDTWFRYTGNSTIGSTKLALLEGGGNVGIGTTAPAEKLHVAGNIMLDNNTALKSKRVAGNAFNLIGINSTGQGFIEIGEASTIPDGMYIYTPTDTGQGVTFHNGTDPLMYVQNDGNVGIGTTSPDESLDVVGAGRFSTGVTFGTDTAAANKLDDYEEGTFTPVLKIGGATTGIGYGAAVGSYTKIGNLVNASLYVLLSSKGSATGSVTIDGLPFASANTTNGFASAHIGSILACTWANYPAGYLSKNTSAITFNQYTEAGGSSAISNSNLTDTSSFIMSITYRV